ncbi:orotate phosphoribosyltransferase [Aureibacillus halotolerans]|uniref:Orotate phosphoribosyltransferase n=1 Tax=Aureibacillus halotolerans TaxID=1508390 RepID=A0A4V3D629_9BACI|nr:orotate phosphoribosyltransferase [Aureibacillus halotolerans]TDQ42357.1 orotate phosphoribosyltransferase [Aureibacillus halotolerans]
MTYEKDVANALLDIGAVAIQPKAPFTWSSGLKSPIYCDNRLLISYPTIRRSIASKLKASIVEAFGDVDVVAGTATAGIPHAAWVSELLDCPMVYVRGKAKAHGTGSLIEGVIQKGQKVVVIEDLLSTGRSAISAVAALREEGAEVVGIASIFTYQMQECERQLQTANTKAISLSSISALLELAKERGLEEKEAEAVLAWVQKPEKEDWQL